MEVSQVPATHRLTPELLAGQIGTDLENGLTQEEAELRLSRLGENELIEKPGPSFLAMLLGQFNNFLVMILIIAAILSILLGEIIDATAIAIIVLLNATLGVIQEHRAEQALAALKRMAAPTAQVIRDGHQRTMPARELVVGDIVLLEAGNYIPADLRLIESVNLRIDEASLTGESVPVGKDARVVLDEDIPIGDRRNSAFMSSLVTYGRGKGLVIATGMQTQIGLIAEMLQSYQEESTPLQQKLDQLGKWLGLASLTICVAIFVLGIVRNTEPLTVFSRGIAYYLTAFQHEIIELFMVAVALAIAAVPEGLPAVVTICLAVGMQRMVKRHALIRRLPAVETLGCATVICSDKTGTLTQNEMSVVRGWLPGAEFEVTGEGYNPTGRYQRSGQVFDSRSDLGASLVLHGALLCNDARLERLGEGDGERAWRIVGDPTEGALVVAAAKAGLWRDELAATLPRVMEIPFDSERKRMTTVHSMVTPTTSPDNDQMASAVRKWSEVLGQCPMIAFVKGAPDVVLQLSDSILQDGQLLPLTDEIRQQVLAANQDMARRALRVLGVACRPFTALPDSTDSEELESKLVFVGLLGMIDLARPEVKAAIAVGKGAGLKTMMVTGDYKDTALAIAEEIGLLSPGGRVLTGTELDRLSTDELAGIIEDVDVCARVSPQHKVKIVDALAQRGHVVAMTGDGVNDAPALKRASIGVAMGIAGTDVSKAAADMVLTDDNYASIVAAIEEGRIIYSNIRKFVFYLISCNVGEVLIIFLAMVAGLPIPLRPIQILWINLVTDGAPALALGLEKGDPDIMKRPPRPTREPVINRDMRLGTAVQGLVMTLAVLLAFVIGLHRFPGQLEAAQTMAFATLVMSELFRAYNCRSERHSVFAIGLFSNRWMTAATAFSFTLLLLVMYVPFLQPFFDTVALGPRDWLVIAPFMFAAPIAAEVTKAYMRRSAAQGPS